jgi:hypothetical protein
MTARLRWGLCRANVATILALLEAARQGRPVTVGSRR